MEPGNGKLNSTEWCLNQNDCLIIPNIQFYGLQIPFLNLLAHITARSSPVPRFVDVMVCCTRYMYNAQKKIENWKKETFLWILIFFFEEKYKAIKILYVLLCRHILSDWCRHRTEGLMVTHQLLPGPTKCSYRKMNLTFPSNKLTTLHQGLIELIYFLIFSVN